MKQFTKPSQQLSPMSSR